MDDDERTSFTIWRSYVVCAIVDVESGCTRTGSVLRCTTASPPPRVGPPRTAARYTLKPSGAILVKLHVKIMCSWIVTSFSCKRQRAAFNVVGWDSTESYTLSDQSLLFNIIFLFDMYYCIACDDVYKTISSWSWNCHRQVWYISIIW